MAKRSVQFSITGIAIVVAVAIVWFIDGSVSKNYLHPKSIIVTYSSASSNTEEHRNRTFKGFEIVPFVSNLDHPVALTFDHKQRLFVVQENGDVLYFVDRNKDANIESRGLFAHGFVQPSDIALGPNNLLYVSDANGVSLIENPDGDVVGDFIDLIVSELPHGTFAKRPIAFSSDRLYIAQRASSVDGVPVEDRDPLEGTVIETKIDGNARSAFASGFYNPTGLAYDPTMDVVYATQQSSPKAQQREGRLDTVQSNGFYGWPECTSRKIRTEDATLCTSVPTPLALFDEDTGLGSTLVYRTSSDLVERYPLEFQGAVFIVEEKAGAIGAVFTEGILDRTIETFAQGFQHPIDIALGPIGSLFVADYDTGTIYILRAVWK